MNGITVRAQSMLEEARLARLEGVDAARSALNDVAPVGTPSPQRVARSGAPGPRLTARIATST